MKLSKINLAKSKASAQKPAPGKDQENGSNPDTNAQPRSAPLSLGGKKLSLGQSKGNQSQSEKPRLSLGSKKLSLNLDRSQSEAEPKKSEAPSGGVSKTLSLRYVRKVYRTSTGPTEKGSGGGGGGLNLRALLGASAMGSRAKPTSGSTRPAKEDQGGTATGGVRACTTESGSRPPQLLDVEPKNSRRVAHTRRNTTEEPTPPNTQVRKVKTSVARKDDVRALEEKLKTIENEYKELMGHNKILSTRIDEMLDKMVIVREWTKNVQENVNQMSMRGYPPDQVAFMTTWISSIGDLLSVQGSPEQDEWKIVRETLGDDAKVLDGAFRTLVQQQTEIYKMFGGANRGVPWYEESSRDRAGQNQEKSAAKRSRSLDPRWFK